MKNDLLSPLAACRGLVEDNQIYTHSAAQQFCQGFTFGLASDTVGYVYKTRTLQEVISEHWEIDGSQAGGWRCRCGHELSGITDDEAHAHLRDEIHVWMMKALTQPGVVESYRRLADEAQGKTFVESGWDHPADAAVAEFLGWMIDQGSTVEEEVDG